MKALAGVLTGLLLLLQAGGCAPVATRSPSAPADPQVAELRARCAAPRAGTSMECYDGALLELMRTAGVREAMAVLDRLAAADEAVRRDGHMYAHSIGLAAYTTADQVGSTFRQCLPILQSGCYHGVIQAYFVDQSRSAGPDGVGAEAVNELCRSYRQDPEGRWLLFQCAHGMGHGLTMVHGHDLRRALAGCDLLRDAWEREGCYGGAFMENIVQAVSPHHAVGRPQHHPAAAAADAHHGEHAHHAAPAAPAFRALDPADPLYPCSALERRYLHACYQMQTSVMLHFNRGDIPAAARTCDTAPEPYRPTCYQSLGRDISAYTLQDHARAASLCSSGDPAYQPWCHVGYVKNLVDVTAAPDAALAYCRILGDPAATTACYRAVGEELAVLTAEPAARRAACGAAGPGHAEVCAAGAGVREER